MITYKKGSLFDAPKGSILVHACNAQGVWGSGIAKEFKARFPESFEFYHEVCVEEGDRLLGVAIICPEENEYNVTGLITSDNYGGKVDPPAKILANTKLAVEGLLKFSGQLPIHSNKFNSGLFNVPWEETERVLKDVMEAAKYTGEWTVWEQA